MLVSTILQKQLSEGNDEIGKPRTVRIGQSQRLNVVFLAFWYPNIEYDEIVITTLDKSFIFICAILSSKKYRRWSEG